MTNYEGGSTAPLAVNETVSTDSPKVELGKSKAIVAAVAGLAVAVGPVLTTALADGAIERRGCLAGCAAWGQGQPTPRRC